MSTLRRLDVSAIGGRVALAGVLTLAAFLRLERFGSVAPNPFYDAAVRSMGGSWHNFFFGAFEPGGSVSVDKIPLDLWLQVASVKLFGFGTVALRLPEALAGILAVPLLYNTVRRVAGRPAALASAAALAVLPLAVLTARSDTMDSVMMALLVLSAWLVVRAVASGGAGWLAGAGVTLGLAFNVKLFEALAVAPALLVCFWLGANGGIRARLRGMLVASVAFVATALAWVIPASLTPRSQRPFPIGSAHGGIWDVIFVFNGSSRLTGHAGVRHPPITRLFVDSGPAFGSLVGGMLAGALVLGAVALVTWRGELRPRARDPRQRMLRGAVAAVATWLVTGTAVFTLMQRLHPRYVEAMTPAIAMALGCGLVALWSRKSTLGAALFVLLTAVGVGLAAGIGGPAHGVSRAIAVIAVVLAAACVVASRTALPWGSAAGRLALAAALAAILVIPAGRAAAIARAGVSDSGRPGHLAHHERLAITRYLAHHSRRTRFELASSSALAAGPLIAHDGRPVLILTTLYGRALTSVATLRAEATAGRVRYALLHDGKCVPRKPRSAACATSVRWVRAHGVDVSRRAGLPDRGILYRLPRAR